jgi:hypothetical protein
MLCNYLRFKILPKKSLPFLCLFVPILYLTLVSCNTNIKRDTRIVERSFYYWKSVFKLSAIEKQALDTLRIKTLYLKFFDVDWDENSKVAIPIAQLRVTDSMYLQKSKLNIVPTIFITNECIYKIDTGQTRLLAEKIFILTKKTIANTGLQNIQEIQIDCDWTATTKEKYFTILSRLQELEKEIKFSVTIRLHQIKFLSKTGVPPVKRGILMCYNMGNLTNIETNNSILETKELQKYIADLQHYPLALDVAFPLFDWKVLFRNGKFKSLVNNLDNSLLVKDIFSKNGNKYMVLKDTMLNGYEFKKDDLLRNEQSNYNQVLKTSEIISEKISNKNLRVSLYHLDTLTLKKYTMYEMENIYDAMH